MKIHADLGRAAFVNAASLDWIPSPAGGIERRMIERDGDEVARVTSIVRYAAGSRFPAHTHGGGEEFLVLEGTFRDENGACPAGTYVRNPPGTRHAPFTDEGCTILVKLWWMHPDDQSPARIDTKDPGAWQPSELAGVAECLLHRHPTEHTLLLRLEPGAELLPRSIDGGEELFVIDGEARDTDTLYTTWSWVRRPRGTAPALISDSGCTLYVKRGHLAHPPPPPGS